MTKRTYTPEQRAAINARLREYRQRPEVKARIAAQQRSYYDREKASKSRREYVQKVRERGVHTETLVSRSIFDAMLAEQGGVCAICRQPETKLSAKGRVRRLAIDHDHRTGRIRALLCSRCNTVVGYLKDDYRLAERAAVYMRDQERQSVAWAMEAAVGSAKPLITRHQWHKEPVPTCDQCHRVDELQHGAAERMQEAVG